MRDTQNKSIAILALNAGTRCHERGILIANGFTAVKPLDGVYKGEHETAWLVCLRDEHDRKAIIELAAKYNQEAVLFSDVDRESTLVSVADGRQQVIGVLTKVPEHFAKEQDSYTYDPDKNAYWVCL